MTEQQRQAALRLADESAKLPRDLLDIACRVRVNECLYRDDLVIDEASHALKEATDLLRELAAEPVVEPVAYGLLKPDGSIDTELVGTQADCEYWSRADNEPQSGWQVTPLFAHPPQQRLRADAERYRWLAANCRSTSEHWGGRWSIVVDGPAPTRHDDEDAFDAAIDAAMKEIP